MIDINSPIIEKIKHTKLLAKQSAKTEWDAMRDKADDYGKGRTEQYTKLFMNTQAIKEVPIDNNNVTKRIIDRNSLVYSVEPLRTFFNDAGKEQEPSTEYIEATKFKNETMHDSEKQTNLLRLIGIKPTLRKKTLKDVTTNVFDYDILVDFELAFGRDPMIPIGVSYPLMARAEVRSNVPELWVYIDAVNYVVYNRRTNEPASDEFQVYEDHLNPYGIVPIVWAFKAKPTLSFIDIDPANDIISMNESINVLGTAQSANVIYQSYGDAIVTGIDKKDQNKFKKGPNVIGYLPTDATYEIHSPPDTLQSVTAALKYKIRSVALNYHLPHGFLEDDTNPESGVAKKERNRELQDEKRCDVVSWRNNEDEIYDIETIIWAVDMKKELPAKQVIDYTETEEILTVAEQRDKDEYELKHGLISEAEIYLRENPDYAIKIKDMDKRLEEVQTKVIDVNKDMSKTEPDKTEEQRLTDLLNETP